MESYTVLARKWRPQTFEEVVGQDHVTTTLKNAITQGRVGQGYLFIGTRGVGKTTIARILAKALNCLSSDGPVPTPCGTCANCTAIRDGRCLDVMEIDGASNRGIEEIRRLRDSVSIAPVSARFKIYIIDEVHMLTREAFNALLKTLEEPPPHVKFFFATTEPHKIPATILSRVQKFELRRISWSDLLDYLGKIAREEHADMDDGALADIARAGNGSVRDALSVFDQVLALAEDRVTEEQVVALLGWTDRETYVELSKAIIEQDAGGALDAIHRVMEKGRDPSQFVLGLLQFMRNILLVKSARDPETIIEESPEFLGTLKDAAEHYTTEQLLYSIDVLLELLPRLEATEAKQTALELAALKLIHARRRVSLDDVFTRLAALEGGSVVRSIEAEAGPPEPSPSSPSEPARASDKEELPTLDEAWRTFMEAMASDDPKLHSFLETATVRASEPSVIQLLYSREDEMSFNAVRTKKTLEEIRMKVSKAAGRQVEINVEREREERKEETKRKPTREELFEKARNDPMVKHAIELFPGSEIIDVEE